MHLPDMTGMQLAQKMRLLGLLARTGFVLITSQADAQEANLQEQSGKNDKNESSCANALIVPPTCPERDSWTRRRIHCGRPWFGFRRLGDSLRIERILRPGVARVA